MWVTQKSTIHKSFLTIDKFKTNTKINIKQNKNQQVKIMLKMAARNLPLLGHLGQELSIRLCGKGCRA